jgi:hypothetical protein
MRFLLLLRVAVSLCAVHAESGVVTTPTAATFDDAVRSHAKVKLKTRNVSIYSVHSGSRPRAQSFIPPMGLCVPQAQSVFSSSFVPPSTHAD